MCAFFWENKPLNSQPALHIVLSIHNPPMLDYTMYRSSNKNTSATLISHLWWAQKGKTAQHIQKCSTPCYKSKNHLNNSQNLILSLKKWIILAWNHIWRIKHAQSASGLANLTLNVSSSTSRADSHHVYFYVSVKKKHSTTFCSFSYA